MSDDFYRAFEEKYRGSRELIKSRQRVYLPFIEPLRSIYDDAKAIDLGCGRGEWLELLKDAGFDGYGADLNEGMLATCQQRGLNVIMADAIAVLKALPDKSQLVVSGFHIAEHIRFSDLQILVQEALRVLKPAGLLILETPNPENIIVGSCTFYLDPTHRQPIPPQLLSFLPEHYGFARTKILRLQESVALTDDRILSLKDVFDGVSPDYAVVAQKAADESILTAFDKIFEPEYGVSLGALVDIYDKQTKNAQTIAEEASARAQAAESQALQAETSAQQAAARALRAEVKTLETEKAAKYAQAIAEEAVTRAQAAESKALQLVQSFNSRLSRNTVMRATTARQSDFQKIPDDLTESPTKRLPRTIAVDLTPILPGGENGGAKIFVLELLRRLAEMSPQTQFVLLTQAASHEELATLDQPNVRRVMVIGPVAANSLHPRLRSLASFILPHLPARLRSIVGRIGYKWNAILKRRGSDSLLSDMSADLLFCPFTAPTYFELGIPTVCTIYDLQYKTYPGFFSAEDVAHRERTFIEACRRATALAAISNYSRDSAIAHGRLDPERIRTIHLRMAQRIAPAIGNDKAILDRLGLSPQQYLIYPANFWKHKNHEMLLTAFGMACHGGLATDIKLVCTGAPGPRQEWLMSAARTMNLDDRVLFPGYLPNADLASLMASCTGMVFPSLYEGFGLPIIEAMAAGVPVACSNTTSLPEVAADAAILFDPRVPTQIAQAMISLVENEALRARLIQAGQQRATEFSDAERMAREYWEMFQYALATEAHENLLTGVYADGWAGPSLNVQVAPAKSAQTLEIEFSAPAWLPQRRFTIQAYQGGKPEGVPLTIARGTNAVLSLPIDPKGGRYEVRIAPTFVPAHSGHGDDQRELSMLLQRCSIVANNANRIELFHEKIPA